jgi:amylosucrase/maltose alpha-D-glucosyltransferase/alpha-amylase
VAAGFDPEEHRRFLTRFYTGRHDGGFARGQPFQEEPETGDARVSGTFASLAGVEKAIEEGDEAALDLAIRRMLLLYGVIVTIGGIPLIYLGDEVATLNDDSYEADPEKAGDSRWLHRVRFDREHARRRRDVDSVPGRVFNGLMRLLRIRGQNPAFQLADTEFVETGNPHVFAYIRSGEDGSAFVLANFADSGQRLEARRLRQMGMRKTMIDLWAGRVLTATHELEMEPYQLMILGRAE